MPLRTEVGEQYTNHYDAYEHDTFQGDRVMKDGGNRVITALVYLNEPEEGGETELVNIGLKIKPAAGKMLVFHDCCKQPRPPASPRLRPDCSRTGATTRRLSD